MAAVFGQDREPSDREMQVGISDVPLGCKRYCRILEVTGLRCSGPSGLAAQLRMDAARGPAARGAPPPRGWLLSPGRPLRSTGRRRRGGSAAGSPAPLQLLLLLPFLLRRATPGRAAGGALFSRGPRLPPAGNLRSARPQARWRRRRPGSTGGLCR